MEFQIRFPDFVKNYGHSQNIWTVFYDLWQNPTLFLIYGILSCILGMSFTPYSKYVIQSKIDFWHCLNHLDSTILTNISYGFPHLRNCFWQHRHVTKNVQCTLVIVNAWIVNNLSLVNIFGETGWFFYKINYMLNSEHLSLVNKIGDKTELTITRVHCT